jgi:hypothetical protein
MGQMNAAYSVELIANATSYEWTIPAGASIVSGKGTHSIIVNYLPVAESGIIEVYGLNGCGTGNTSSISITTNPLPDAPVITLSGYMFTSSAAEGNQWFKNGISIDGATTQSYEATSAGSYSASVTLAGCPSPVSNSISVLFTGITVPAVGKFVLSPVPSNGLFTATMSWPGQEIFTIRVYNNIGGLVYENKNVLVDGSAKQTIDLRNASSGMYTVLFTSGSNRITRKILINR